MILRRIARSLLAPVFISRGLHALRQPDEHVRVAKPLINQVVGQRSDMLPESVPTDAATLVRVDAAVKIGAGSALAMGKFPRLSSALLLGSLVPTTLVWHPFWEEDRPAERAEQLTQFYKNAGLAGGLLLAAVDTEGKPSLGWRARRAARKTGKQVEHSGVAAKSNARDVQRKTRRGAKRARKRARAALPR